MKRAAIFLRQGELFFDTESQTKDTLWVSTEDVLTCDVEDLDRIASSLRSALDRSRTGVETPRPSADLTGPLLAAAKVKSWSTFIRGAKCVSAGLEDGLITLTPQRRMQASYADVFEKERTIRLYSESLGQAVLDAMADATS
jgi:hypothetical protein